MPKKIKVVNISDNTPLLTEQVETKVDEPVQEVQLPDPPIEDVKPEVEPEVKPEVKPKTTRAVKPKSVVKEEPKIEMVEPEPALLPKVPEPEPKANESEVKSEPTGTCELCGKTMLLKNLKYAHPKVCKKKPPSPPPAPPSPPNIIVEKVIVMQNPEEITKHHQSTDTFDLLTTIRNHKTEQRKNKIRSLIAQAF